MTYSYINSNLNSISFFIIFTLGFITLSIIFAIFTIILFRKNADKNDKAYKLDKIKTVLVCSVCLLLIIFVVWAAAAYAKTEVAAVYRELTQKYETIDGKLEITDNFGDYYGRSSEKSYNVKMKINGYEMMPSNSFTEKEFAAMCSAENIRICYITDPELCGEIISDDKNEILWTCNCIIIKYEIY